MAIRALQGRSEEPDFECKLKRNSANGAFDNDDRQNLGRELSALANSMGGLLLWGVEAARNPASGLDLVSDFHPIADLKRFETEARTLSAEALMPRIHNVEFASIEEPEHSGAGYLAMYIARSERRPHRCEFRGAKGYFRRSMTSAREMEHFEIEDAFRSFLVPELEVNYTLYEGATATGPMGNAAEIGVELSLKNISNVLASFPYICVGDARPKLSWDSSRPVFGINQRIEGANIYFEGDANCVLNPNVSRVFGRIKFSAPFLSVANGPRFFQRTGLPPLMLRCFGATVGCVVGAISL